MFKTLLIANRGEIACRIIKTAKRLGIRTIAIYSSADAKSLHVQSADVSACVGGPSALESYLNPEKMIQIAREFRADAIHPGYGFLSEHADFATACQNANLIFVGPSPEAMRLMGSKQYAKQVLETLSVPLIPGYHGVDQTPETLTAEAQRIGFPLLIKPALGGGGKGIHRVMALNDFEPAIQQARREAHTYFASDILLLERIIDNPRHIEVQIMADNHGHIVHLFTRDCSIQRREQKIIEEAPAPHLSPELEKTLTRAALDVAKAIHYSGAGTVEFLVDEDENVYFLEMNTRLQVEHPVTEMITGVDIVEWQLRIAANEPLPYQQEDILCTGHAIECRVCAEDPLHHFLPSIGNLQVIKQPKGEGIRVDHGIHENDTIHPYYDSLFAKVITHGGSRLDAIARMDNALSEYRILGIKTNLAFLKEIINHPQFLTASINTHFLSQVTLTPPILSSLQALLIAASYETLCELSSSTSLLRDTFAWHVHHQRYWIKHYLIENTLKSVIVSPLSFQQLRLEIDAQVFELTLSDFSDSTLSLSDGALTLSAHIHNTQNTLSIFTDMGQLSLMRCHEGVWNNAPAPHVTQPGLIAPMHATVVALLKQPGDTVLAGEPVLILEAMKMEHTLCAHEDSRLVEFLYPLGAQVDEGNLLANLLPLQP